MPTISTAKAEPPFWQLPVTALMERLNSSPEGLSSAEAAARLIRFGPNLIHAERKRALVLQFLAKFRNPPVIILLTVSALSAFTGDAASFFIIGAIVLTSVTLDFVQEYRAGQTAERLRQSVAVRGQVLREGKPLEIPLEDKPEGEGETVSKPTRASHPIYGLLPVEVEGFDSLAELALDMRWSWNHCADEVWRQLDPALWELTRNPWVVLQTVSREQIERMSADPAFRKKMDALVQTRRHTAPALRFLWNTRESSGKDGA